MEQFDRADRVLVLTSEAFDFPAKRLPQNVRYVGPQLGEPIWAKPWRSPWPEDHPDPLVVVGFSTTPRNQAPVLRKMIEALGGLRMRGLVTVGPSLDPAAFEAPANVVVRRSVAHAQVFPEASAVLTHAGHGTVIRALRSGIPLACVPMGRDQGDDAARMVARGAGLHLSREAPVAEIREVIQSVVEQPRFREGARRLSRALAADISEQRGMRELEGLVAVSKTAAARKGDRMTEATDTAPPVYKLASSAPTNYACPISFRSFRSGYTRESARVSRKRRALEHQAHAKGVPKGRGRRRRGRRTAERAGKQTCRLDLHDIHRAIGV
ncbi:MAG TPA: nucleotide disphospho-sugar-binding domain-containing protein, partial [Rubrobacter sp.]